MPRTNAALIEREALQSLLSDLQPGTRLRRVRELRGGLSAHMQVLDGVGDEGARSSIVLRRFHPQFHYAQERAGREFRTLEVLQKSPVAAPKPLWMDLTGGRFDTPSMALSYLPGRVVVAEPRKPKPWLESAAKALLKLQQITPESHDLTHLEIHDASFHRRKASLALKKADSQQIRHLAFVLKDRLGSVQWLPLRLVHGDFWPANVIWHRGRISGIIDWTFACVGDPREDVSQYRLDLALITGKLDLADAFLDTYNSIAPQPLHDIWFFDLQRSLGALNALTQYDEWLKGYHNLGLTQITPEILNSRLQSFIQQALSHVAVAR